MNEDKDRFLAICEGIRTAGIINGRTPEIIVIDEVGSTKEAATKLMNEQALADHERLMKEDDEYRVQFERGIETIRREREAEEKMAEKEKQIYRRPTRLEKRKLLREQAKLQRKEKFLVSK